MRRTFQDVRTKIENNIKDLETKLKVARQAEQYYKKKEHDEL